MGGNALKEYTSRKKADEYKTIVDIVLEALRDNHHMHVEELPYYRSKESFGDADLLVSTADLDTSPVTYLNRRMPKWFAEVLKDLDTEYFYQNKPVYGLECGGLQVDLITIRPEEFQVAKNYYAWNDLGNLIGRIAHKMGFKYGHRGLLYIMRHDESHAFGEVVITQDIHEILTFLGYDPQPFIDGFDTLEQVWEYAASSKYFNPAIYQIDNLNSKSKVRDKKRATYMGFLEWLAKLKPDNEYPWGDRVERRAYWLGKALGTFPEFSKRFIVAQKKEAETQAGRHKWNGDLVLEWTGAKHRMLGNFMSYVRQTAHWCKPEILHEQDAERMKQATLELWTAYQLTEEYASTKADMEKHPHYRAKQGADSGSENVQN